MKRTKIIFFFMLFVISMSFCFAAKSEDALRFKTEYESLNGMPRSTTTFAIYNATQIQEENYIHYISGDEAATLIKNGTSLIYLGAPWCPWCRNLIPVLIEAAELSGVETIYYVDVTEERDQFSLIDWNLVRTAEGTPGYQKLLSALDAYLEPYTLESDDGVVGTGEKRILIPFLVLVREGKIKHAELASYPLEEGQSKYDLLEKGQKEALLNRLLNLLSVF